MPVIPPRCRQLPSFASGFRRDHRPVPVHPTVLAAVDPDDDEDLVDDDLPLAEPSDEESNFDDFDDEFDDDFEEEENDPDWDHPDDGEPEPPPPPKGGKTK